VRRKGEGLKGRGEWRIEEANGGRRIVEVGERAYSREDVRGGRGGDLRVSPGDKAAEGVSVVVCAVDPPLKKWILNRMWGESPPGVLASEVRILGKFSIPNIPRGLRRINESSDSTREDFRPFIQRISGKM